MDQPNADILRVLYKNRKHILLVTFIGALIAVAVTFIIKPKYRSQAYLYPANMVPFFMEGNYNNVSHSELLLQFFNSNDVRNEVRKKLNLDRHYGLDPESPMCNSYFDYTWEENIKTSLTKYESIELSVLDHDADTALLIASNIIEAVNSLILKQHTKKFNEFIAVNNAYLSSHRKSLDSLQQCMEVFTKKYQLIDMGSQMREASKNYYQLQASGKSNDKLDETMKNMAEHGPELFRIGNALQEEARLYATIENEVEKSVRDFNRRLTYMVVASEPTRPDIKYWPKRGLTTVIAALASFLLGCLYFIYIGRLQALYVEMKKSQ